MQKARERVDKCAEALQETTAAVEEKLRVKPMEEVAGKPVLEGVFAMSAQLAEDAQLATIASVSGMAVHPQPEDD